jgi:hypothetical protein
MNSMEIRKELGWKLAVTLTEGIDKVIFYSKKMRRNGCLRNLYFCGKLRTIILI